MKISIDRIGKKLKGDGFELAFFNKISYEIDFVRRFSRDLFERIEIHQGYQRGGKKGDVVSASVACSIVPGETFLKGMGETRCLTEIAAEPDGWTFLSGKADAEKWEDQLARVGPQQAHAMCVEHGPRIASSTLAVRDLGRGCLESCRKLAASPKELLAAINSQAQGWQLEEWKRILRCRVPVFPNEDLFHEIAVLAIVVHSGKLKGDARWFVGKDPDSAEDRELMILIQFMASILAGEPAWGVPYFPP
jgi:hypothetical protein